MSWLGLIDKAFETRKTHKKLRSERKKELWVWTVFMLAGNRARRKLNALDKQLGIETRAADKIHKRALNTNRQRYSKFTTRRR